MTPSGDELHDTTLFPTVTNATGEIQFKLRSEICVGDMVISPEGVPKPVVWKGELGPDLYRITLPETAKEPESFLCSARQRLYLKAKHWPKKSYDERSNCFIISWVSCNMLRRTSIPLRRLPHAHVVWNMVQNIVEPILLPLEMYESLPKDRRDQLVLSKTHNLNQNHNQTKETELSFSIDFAGYGCVHAIHVTGNEPFVSKDGTVFIE